MICPIFWNVFCKQTQSQCMILDIVNVPDMPALREGSSQTNVILQYKLLAAILSAVCSVILQW